jgi:hypothetical protein
MRRAPIALALAALPLGASACGGGGSTTSSTTQASAAPAVRAAIAKTAKAPGEHVAVTASATAGGQSIRLAGSGDYDAADHQGKLHVDFALGGVQTGLDEVLDGSTVYATSPLFAAVLPSGKTWLKVDLRAVPKSFAVAAAALATQNPSSALAQLQALTGLKQVGTATVGGLQATRYRGRIDVAKLPASSAAAVRSSGATFGAVDVWVGSDGYVHKLRVPARATAGGRKARTTVTLTLSGFGKQPSVSPPPASQTADASTIAIPGLGG